MVSAIFWSSNITMDGVSQSLPTIRWNIAQPIGLNRTRIYLVISAKYTSSIWFYQFLTISPYGPKYRYFRLKRKVWVTRSNGSFILAVLFIWYLWQALSLSNSNGFFISSNYEGIYTGNKKLVPLMIDAGGQESPTKPGLRQNCLG